MHVVLAVMPCERVVELTEVRRFIRIRIGAQEEVAIHVKLRGLRIGGESIGVDAKLQSRLTILFRSNDSFRT